MEEMAGQLTMVEPGDWKTEEVPEKVKTRKSGASEWWTRAMSQAWRTKVEPERWTLSEAREGNRPSWRLRDEKSGGFRGMTNHCEAKARSGIMASEGQGEPEG